MLNRNSRTALVSAAAALALLIVAPVQAGGPLANFEPGQPFLYPGGGVGIAWNPDQGGLGPLDNAGAVAQSTAAFQAWEDIPSATATYTNAGLLPVDVDTSNFFPWVFPSSPDGLSAVIYDEDGSLFDLLFGPGTGVLGFSGPEWGNFLTGEILESVAFLNGGAILDGFPLAEFLDVQVHEFGHFSNLAHTVTNGQIPALGDNSGPTPNNTFPLENLFDRIETMYPFILIGGGMESPHPDDIAIFSTLYPEPDFFATTGTITGTILAPDGATQLTGVNVIARNTADPYDDAVSAISSDFTDSTVPGNPFVGVYTLNGLTPGASYAVYVDQILAGGFSTPILFPQPNKEELYNGANESFDPDIDIASEFTPVAAVAGTPTTGIDIIFNRLAPGDPIPLGDDTFFELFMPFSFSFCGHDYDSVFVNSNGSISFGAGSTDFSESAGDLLGGPPRIAPFWDDLNPLQGGIVTFDQSANLFTVSWTDVPEFFATGANTFSVTLHRSSNQFDLAWGDLSASDGLAGFSCGGQAATGAEPEVDLTAVAAMSRGAVNGRNAPAIYEQWSSSDPNDVANSAIDFTAPNEFKDKNEPNNSLADATGVQLPFTSGDAIGDSGQFRYTDISPEGADIDFFAFDAVAGTTLTAATSGGGMDTLIGLFDVATGDLLDTDDDGGPGLFSQIVYPINVSGRYAIAVTTFPDFDFDGDGGDSGRYVLTLEAVEGIILDLGDDDNEEVPFVNFAFPFQGQMWTSVFVNSNGNLTFGSGDNDFSESVSEFLNETPRIAALWDDLSPNNGGQVSVERTATSMTVNFDDVPEFFATGANTFSVTMNADGSIDIVYGDVSANDGIVGVTEGGGAADPGETDLSAGGPFSASGTTYERFTSSDAFDLDLSTLLFLP